MESRNKQQCMHPNDACIIGVNRSLSNERSQHERSRGLDFSKNSNQARGVDRNIIGLRWLRHTHQLLVNWDGAALAPVLKRKEAQTPL